MMRWRDMARPKPGSKRSTDLVRNGGDRLVEDRARRTRFHVSTELVQQDGPVRGCICGNCRLRAATRCA